MKGKTVTSLYNRLLKNQKKLKNYLKQNQIEAFRLYNKDIPEYPYLIDIYGNRAVIYEQGKKLSEELTPIRKSHQEDIKSALQSIFGIPESHQYFKVREKQKGNEQYRPLDARSKDFFLINEPPMKFLINLERYLDTGLFLDHRPLRQHLLKISSDKSVLNLFCYTGSLSVASALGGGKVTSIDMSKTYLEWAIENFRQNGIDHREHEFCQADILKELLIRREKKETFDIVILDPPSFSNSKRMEDDLDIERDHPLLIRDSMALLEKEGTLFFSTNKRKFELHPVVKANYFVKEITNWTIPQDFSHSYIHRTFEIKEKLL